MERAIIWDKGFLVPVNVADPSESDEKLVKQSDFHEFDFQVALEGNKSILKDTGGINASQYFYDEVGGSIVPKLRKEKDSGDAEDDESTIENLDSILHSYYSHHLRGGDMNQLMALPLRVILVQLVSKQLRANKKNGVTKEETKEETKEDQDHNTYINWEVVAQEMNKATKKLKIAHASDTNKVRAHQYLPMECFMQYVIEHSLILTGYLSVLFRLICVLSGS